MTAAPGAPVDVLLVSLGSTAGLRAVDGELADSIAPRGASVAMRSPRCPSAAVRTLALTDLRWARAARHAAAARARRAWNRAR